jgi:phosphatidate phosphatase
MVQCYGYIGWFLYGGGMQVMTVETGKRVIGRLRPHFLAACFPSGPNCSTASNEYIVDYTCSGNPDVINEARLSFPSGHASLSFYAATFTAMYLQIRMVWKSSKLLKHLLQFLVVMAAWFTALTRVSDYMHHWSDVLAGIVIGTLFGILIILFASSLHRKHLGSQPMELTTLLRRSNPPSSTTDNSSRGENNPC